MIQESERKSIDIKKKEYHRLTKIRQNMRWEKGSYREKWGECNKFSQCGLKSRESQNLYFCTGEIVSSPRFTHCQESMFWFSFTHNEVFLYKISYSKSFLKNQKNIEKPKNYFSFGFVFCIHTIGMVHPMLWTHYVGVSSNV